MSPAGCLLCLSAVLALAGGACTSGKDSSPNSPTGTDSAGETGQEIPVDPDAHVGTLDNGLTYYVRHNERPGGRAELRLVINAGSALEDDDQSGVAHFLEHMMFNGTEQYPKNELVKVLESFGMAFGADVNAYTSYDETVYALSIPTDDPAILATAFGILSEWLSAATLTEADVTAERGVVLDEWRQSEESESGRLSDAIETMFLGGTRYEGRDPIGTADAIAAMTPEPLQRFYDEWYRPDNAAVVVVGDIDVEKVEAAIAVEFGALQDRGTANTRPTIELEPMVVPEAAVHLDPDEASGFVEFTLPVPAPPQTTVQALQESTLVALAFDMISTRLGIDATRGEAPFTSASVDSNALVRALDAPSVLLEATGENLSGSLDSLIVEFARADRFGFDESELARSIRSFRASFESAHDNAESTQDADFADLYVSAFLDTTPIPDADTELSLQEAALDAADLDTVNAAFRSRLAASAPHLLVVGPVGAVAPSEAEALAMLTEVGERDLENRAPTAPVADRLMDAPEPVEEASTEPLTESFESYLAPTMLTFPNGARVVLNETPISEGSVAFGASSNGGLSLVADDDVANALAAPTVVMSSGVGELDQVSLEGILANSTVDLAASLDSTSENLYGSSASDDLETFFQLIHLYLSEPKVSPTALDTYVEQIRPYAEDPTTDPDLAGTVDLLDARYGTAVDRFRILPTPEELDSFDAATMRRIWLDRFGDASDWVFVFSGDLETDRATELARRYLGTLPGDGRTETWTDVQPDPPAGVIAHEVRAGTGDRASLTVLYTAAIDDDPMNGLTTQVLASVLNMRLTEHIREALGASYSPFADVAALTEPDSVVETYIQITGSPQGVPDLREVLQDDLADLRAQGPTQDELDSALEELGNNLELFSNEGLIDVLLDETVVGRGAIAEFAALPGLVDRIDLTTITELANAVLPADRYVEVVVLPDV